MTNPTRLGVQKAREQLRRVLDGALLRGEKTVIERHGEPIAAVVPYDWFERAEAALAKETPRRKADPHDDSGATST